MNDKKNIERFFQEKFKDYEVNPNPKSWDSISKKIAEKKSKKPFLPAWLKLGGIAACLLIGYLLYNNVQTNENLNTTEKKSVVVNPENILLTKDTTNLDKNNLEKQKVNVVENYNKTENNIVTTNNTQNEYNVGNTSNPTEKAVELTNESSATSLIKNGIKSKNKPVIANANDNFKNKNNSDSRKNNISKPTIAHNSKPKNSAKTNAASLNFNESKNELATTTKRNKLLKNQKTIDITTLKNSKADAISDKNNLDKYNINLEPIINSSNITSTNAQDLKPNDSLKNAITQENLLNKLLLEKEKLEKKKKLVAESSRWKIRPNVAPIFMKASNGSPIHDIFADNEKTYENKFSYGLGADYAITKKLSIRAGINKFDLAYNTNDVAYYNDLAALNGLSPDNSIQTINLKDEFHNIVIGDKKARAAVITPPNQTAEEVGYLNQNFGYIEIPLEVSYKLLDKRFGITIISGFSTLLLNNNQVSIVSNNKTIVLGDVNNLSKTHYSTNFGLGFKYNFMKSFEINIEPTIKYQINSFDKNNGGFNPYFLGIYSGVSYRL